jgi:hypothetical protein
LQVLPNLQVPRWKKTHGEAVSAAFETDDGIWLVT